MNFLFNLASSSRCQLKDREVDSREKDSEIRDLKEKVVKLVRQTELQKADLIRQEKLMILATQKHPRGEVINYEDYTLKNGAEGQTYDLRPKGTRNYVILNGGGNHLQSLEDMDISDSDHSDMDGGDDDYELEYSDVDADDNSVTSRKKVRRRRAKQRNPKNNSHLGTASYPVCVSDPESSNERTSGGGDSTASQKSAYALCCSCSKQSLCKTSKCKCRVAAGKCGPSCGCEPTKCSNRELASNREGHEMSPSEFGPSLEADEAERSQILASHGAMLLHSALSEKPVVVNDGSGSRRKPLSDIGNTLAKSNAPKPVQRKKWRKSTIQLVPAPTPAATEPENVEGGMAKPEIRLNEGDIPLKLPRAMRSAFMNNNTLRERNSDQQTDSTARKDIGATAPTSPQQQTKTMDEKKNRG